MNSFGTLLRVSMFGESHGQCVGALVDGCPPGLLVRDDDFARALARRRAGRPGTTPRKEPDIAKIMSGVFEERTTGAPILILFENADVDSSAYDETRTTPRPGHADMVAHIKYGGFADHRGGGHFSGRLTAGLVAAGVLGKKILDGVTIEARLLEVGGSDDFEGSAVAASREGDSVGGVVECVADGLPAGLGEPFFDSVESLIAHAAFSIPGIKGVEFGLGFACARMGGAEYNDWISNTRGETETNNSGGINGGITNGNKLVFRAAVRPTASVGKAQRTVDLKTGETKFLEVEGRHDAAIALRMPVIFESVTALVLADLLLRRRAGEPAGDEKNNEP